MKVLMLVTDAYGGHGGIAFYNRCLAEALAEMPEVSEVVVVPRVMRFAPSDVPAKIRFIETAAGRKFRFLACVAGLAAEHFDFVICGHVNLLPVAAPFAKIKRAPLVLLIFGIDVWSQAGRGTRAWVRRADIIWSISEITRDRMNSWVGRPLSNYVLMPPTVQLERFGPGSKRPDLIAQYGLHGRTVLMTLARLAGFERYKGIDEILDVLPSLLMHEPTLTYMVVGDGDDLGRLTRKAAELGVSDRVVFTGFVEEVQKADYLRLADVFALPGKGEGFGIVYLEAMACGIPVVGSCLDGSREALREGSLGELADPNDSESIRSCILRALKSPKGVPPGLSHFAWPRFQARVRDAALLASVGVTSVQ
jgi:phosphatidylinositol alpha-1,6-mannosyltransferase